MILQCKIGINKHSIYSDPINAFRTIKPKSKYILYVVKEANTFFYVGITTQKIQTRLSGSYRAYKNRYNKQQYNGYSGYKWIEGCLNNKKHLDLYLFELPSESNSADIKKFSEAIEAELVYCIRAETNQWPKYQHEIHFHNIETAKKIASEIFKKLIK